MQMTRKQLIYVEILRWVLPQLRNAATQTKRSWLNWRRLPNTYPEAELVHNIPPLLTDPEFKNFDVYWLNTQAQNYVRCCRQQPRPGSHNNLALIAELISLVPANLRPLLTWDIDP